MPRCVTHPLKPDVNCKFCETSTRARENWQRVTSRVLQRLPEQPSRGGPQPFPSQNEEARWLGELVGSPVGRANAHAIPKHIHRFWTGGPMSQGALHNLIGSSEVAARNGWRSFLWYSTTIENLLAKRVGEDKCMIRDTQREVLSNAGYSVVAVETLAPKGGLFSKPPFTQAQIVKVAQMAARSVLQGQGFDDVKYFSDLSRLMYLYAHGGHHLDVDMGLGTMELRQGYHHNDPSGEVPLMGTLGRDSTDQELVAHLRFLQEAGKKGTVTRSQYVDALRFLATRALNGAGMFNALIASRPGTKHLLLALLSFFQKAEQMDMLPSGMSLQVTLLLGPLEKARPEGALNRAEAWSVPPYLSRLDQITDESDAGAGVKK